MVSQHAQCDSWGLLISRYSSCVPLKASCGKGELTSVGRLFKIGVCVMHRCTSYVGKYGNWHRHGFV